MDAQSAVLVLVCNPKVYTVVFYSVVDPDPHHFGNLDPHPDPHPHKIRIRIRINIYKLDPEPDPDPYQFADVKPKCMEYETILELFQGFEPFLS
jgi:hypothetical protein